MEGSTGSITIYSVSDDFKQKYNEKWVNSSSFAECDYVQPIFVGL